MSESALIRIAESFPRKRAKTAVLARLLQSTRPGGDAIALDIGTHQGVLAALLNRGFQAYPPTTTWLDPSSADLEVAKKFVQGNFVTGILEAYLPNQLDAKFDLITSFDSFMYVKEPRSSIREVRRVLKPGGSWVVSGVGTQVSGFWIGKLERALGLSGSSGFLWNPGREEMESVLRESGFEIVRSEEYFGAFSYLLQMALDWLMVKRGGTDASHDQRTSGAAEAVKYIKPPSLALSLALRAIRLTSAACSGLDRAFSKRLRGGWVICARRPA